jgi:predicted outer membrane protein
MRAALAIILLLTSTAALADSGGDAAGDSELAGRAPAGSDLIEQLYQFDLFEQNTIDSADLHGNEEVRNFAVSHAEAAAKRDKALAELRKHTPINANVDKKTGPIHADRSAGLEESDGPAYIREFYQAQVAEYQSAVSLLERYLNAPDNDAVRSFASSELPRFRAGLQDAEDALADK